MALRNTLAQAMRGDRGIPPAKEALRVEDDTRGDLLASAMRGGLRRRSHSAAAFLTAVPPFMISGMCAP
jgi:hypothetical protein